MTDLDPVAAAPGATTAVTFERDQRAVALRDIGIARENLRHGEPPDDDIELLAATLKAAGQLQPLTVRPGRGKKEKPWMALDGRRRRLALGLLLKAGDIDGDYPVTVYVETDPGRQAAAVLLTNTAVPVHVADVIASIGRMLKSRLTVSAIATALGYAEIEVKRLAALAGLPTAALAALKAGRMTLKQSRLLVRLRDADAQAELAQLALDGHGFQDWRIIERLDAGRVTARDRRCTLVSADAYAAAGGRSEGDLFGELEPVLLDPEILTNLWLRRVRSIAAVFEAEGVAVHVTAGPEPDLPDDLEALGYVYGGSLPAEEMARYRAQREVYDVRAETARATVAEGSDAAGDAAIIEMIRARIVADQTGCGGRVVTTLVIRPACGAGVDLRCYTPEEPEAADDDIVDGHDEGQGADQGPCAYAPPEADFPAPDIEGVNHALHAVRTEVATRGLIRALADHPDAALTALVSRLFTVVLLRGRAAPSESALAITASAFTPRGGRVIGELDGEVLQRLDERRADWQASGATVIAWVHALPQDARLSLLAELTGVSLDLQEQKTTMVRGHARADAAELAALCDADIARYWTPDVPFLKPHSKGLLTGMLAAMGADQVWSPTLGKADLVDRVVEQAAARNWAPAALSWGAPSASGDAGAEAAVEHSQDDPSLGEGAGDFVVTAAGEAALSSAAA